MPQMKPIFWLDVLSSNSLCLAYVISMLYFLFLSPPTCTSSQSPLDPHNYNNKKKLLWTWQW